MDKVFKIIAADSMPLMKALLECLIPGVRIQSLRYENKEDPGFAVWDKSVIFDVLCTTDRNEQFTVEVQSYDSDTYTDRMITYSAALIRRQIAEKRTRFASLPEAERHRDSMDYTLFPIYVVSILTGKLRHADESGLRDGLLSSYSLRNDIGSEKLNDSLHFVFLETGRLKIGRESPDKCRTLLEKLAWSVQYMQDVESRPEAFGEDLLEKLYTESEIANMSMEKQELIFRTFDEELNHMSELSTAVRKGREEGRAEGLASGIRQVVSALSASGMDAEEIARRCQIPIEEVLGFLT